MYSKKKVFNFDTEIDHFSLGTVDVHAEGFIEPKRDVTLDDPEEGGAVIFTEISVTDEDGAYLGDGMILGYKGWLEEDAIERAYEPTE